MAKTGGNGVTFRWVCGGLITLLVAGAGFGAVHFDGSIDDAKDVAKANTASIAENRTGIAVVNEIVRRVESKVDRLLDR